MTSTEIHGHESAVAGGKLERYLGRDLTIGPTQVRSKTFTWDVPNTLAGAVSSTTLALAEAGIIIGVDLPQSDAANTLYGWGRAAAPYCPVEKADTGFEQAVVSFFNNTGGAVDPGTKTFVVYYLFQEALP